MRFLSWNSLLFCDESFCSDYIIMRTPRIYTSFVHSPTLACSEQKRLGTMSAMSSFVLYFSASLKTESLLITLKIKLDTTMFVFLLVLCSEYERLQDLSICRSRGERELKRCRPLSSQKGLWGARRGELGGTVSELFAPYQGRPKGHLMAEIGRIALRGYRY